MDLLILGLLILIGWSVWVVFRRSSHSLKLANGSPHTVSLSRDTSTPTVEASDPMKTQHHDCGLFTAEDEQHAFKAGQPVWIRYEDKSGTITERVVEIYRPGDGEVIYTWCRTKRAPRTFVRRNIRKWRMLAERFDFDPVVAKYWDEEGIRERLEKNPWRRWLRRQPKEIAARYM
ncbi:MAG: hypothetical protein QM706_09865 [Nitrospira sp.]